MGQTGMSVLLRDWLQTMIGYRLQPLERSPEVFLASARLSGPRTPLGFPSGYVLVCLPKHPCTSPGAMLLSPRIASIPFIETRQRGFIFQA